MNEAFFAVHLSEEALATTNLGAVLGVVGSLLVGQYIAQRSVGSEVESLDFQVDVPDRAKLASPVYIRLDVDRRQTVREATSLACAVVLFNVTAGTGNGQVVEQGEVVKAKHLHQQRRCLFFVG